ncbi:LytTR family DNA-binding domain-containing protein [Ignavibacterium sp.]|uniref:LytR/AlgR family response regulator transcription factor n=1 Tax=Ignavibacterium sp. TaxID=2651167 RepID=UPI00307D45AD
MIRDLTYNFVLSRQEKFILSLLLLSFLLLSTVGLDLFYAKMNGGSFYLSESIMFSSFWLLFPPIIYLQQQLLKQNLKIFTTISILVLIILLHIVSYPALIWLLSKLFYYHTYSYWQTLNYEITEYGLTTLIIYGFTFAFLYRIKSNPITTVYSVEKENPEKEFLNSIIVTDKSNRKSAIKTDDILYFSSASPYVNIHHRNKKYLSSKTLKFLEANLNNNQFVRIHKSYIVNLKMVVSFKSRLNGDYDLTLVDNTVLRISRNYFFDFKQKFESIHRLNQN